MMNPPSTCAANGTSGEKKPDVKLEDYEIKQIEINTIASSFGGIGSRLTDLHRYVFNRSGDLKKKKKHCNPTINEYPFLELFPSTC